MADMGCQSSLAGLKVVKSLGISVRDLIPVNIKMQAANNDSIRILGATILRLSGKNTEGKERSTRQMVYVTDSTDKLFLSREACVDSCEHQALPLMDSPPMRLMIDPNVTPTAHHSHIPVPLHWQDAVKAGLARQGRETGGP